MIQLPIKYLSAKFAFVVKELFIFRRAERSIASSNVTAVIACNTTGRLVSCSVNDVTPAGLNLTLHRFEKRNQN